MPAPGEWCVNAERGMGGARRTPWLARIDAQLLPWLGRAFRLAAALGLGIFGCYILLRAGGATRANFAQWRQLVAGLPMTTVSDWIANVGIGMHFLMGTVLVVAWPVLFSTRIRTQHRRVHRWTGRVYVSAGFLAGAGGLSYILAHRDGGASHVAFAIWGAVMMASAVMAFAHARARRFGPHRAWAIRLFAMVLGSWLFDLEFQAWKELAGGRGIGAGDAYGPFDYAILYLFFVPNLLVAEFFISNHHYAVGRSRAWRWAAACVLLVAGAVFVYAIVAVSATEAGKYGRHLLPMFRR